MKTFNGVLYCGSNQNFQDFDDRNKRTTLEYYKGTIGYFSSNKNYAHLNAKNIVRKFGGTETIYKVHVRLSKLFDTRITYSGSDLIDVLPQDLEKFSKSAELTNSRKTIYDVLGELTSGKSSLSGKQIYKGLQLSKDVNQANKELISRGFRGIIFDDQNYETIIPFYKQDIKILTVEEIRNVA